MTKKIIKLLFECHAFNIAYRVAISFSSKLLVSRSSRILGTFRTGIPLPSSNWWALASSRPRFLICHQIGLVRVELRSSQPTWKIGTFESQPRKLSSLCIELTKPTRKSQGSATMKIASWKHLWPSRLLWRTQVLLRPQSANSLVCSRWRRRVKARLSKSTIL